MIYARNSDNKYGFISLIFRHLHLLFKQWMLPEKTEKKEGIKLDFHNIGNMKNSTIQTMDAAGKNREKRRNKT